MEFHEKLQELRKSRGLTQEELSEILYVSRTAISKWESGRGYPSIDSLKEISKFFSVTIDDLLSGEKLLTIVEKENRANIKNVCDLLFGIADLFSVLLVILPLYPNPVGEYVYSVNLFAYGEIAPVNRMIYWVLFLSLAGIGLIKILQIKHREEKNRKIAADISMGLSVLVVLFLAMTREAYALTVIFLLMIIKGFLLFKCVKIGG